MYVCKDICKNCASAPYGRLCPRPRVQKGLVAYWKDIKACREKWRIKLPRPENLTNVLLKKVEKIQVVERPMGKCGLEFENGYDEETIAFMNKSPLRIPTSMSGKKDRTMHSGVVVTTEDGSKYLIHKLGPQGNATIIEMANDAMYERGYAKIDPPIQAAKLWEIKFYKDKSGDNYSFMRDNCHHATERMVKLAKRKYIIWRG